MSESNPSGQENVVPLKPKPDRMAAVALTRLPAAMHSLRDKARQQLQMRLRELFDKADDALFELADQSTNNQEQNLYFDSMREVRLRRRTMEATFFRRIDIAFAQLLDPQAHKEEYSTGDDISVDELSLVQNDELEELVATEGMVNKANDEFAEPIQHLIMRIDHLVPVKVYQKNNPLGANVICHAFTEAAKTSRIDVKAKLVLFKLFDKQVMTQLGSLYQGLNQLLIEANILPSLTRAPRIKKGPSGTAYGAGASVNNAQSGGEVRQDAHTNEVLLTLRDLLGGAEQGQAHGVGGSGGGEVLQTDDLVRLLSQAQQQAPAPVASGAQTVNVRALLNGLLGGQRDQHINQVDEDVINLVSMMFEFILDDRNLAAPMKALLGRLQIPMVKVAIADKSFFSKGGHPARRLLNEMANAALGWQERPEDSGQRTDNLYKKMESVVQTVLSDFETDMGIFERLLQDFRAFLEKDKRRAQILEQRTLDAEDGKARSERARAEVNVALARITEGVQVPVEAEQLLREAWANVMFITCLKQGADGEAWQQVCEIAEQLVWSVSAPMDKNNRKELLRVVPRLLPKLRAGLEGISFNPYSMTQLFKQLETLHLSRLRAQVAPAQTEPANVEPAAATVVAPAPVATEVTVPVTEADAPAPEAVSKAPVVAAVEAEATPVESTPEPAAVAPEEAAPSVAAQSSQEPVESAQEITLVEGDQHLALVGNITQGSWFEMLDESGQGYRCRLAAIIKATGKYIFVNRSGMKVAEETREGLALALKKGRLRILDDSMLFDRALEAVIGNLRQARVK
ncbi:DUF1631 domain-containing protein [Marinimicrobium sp. ABcell2]|uniref:DUF1631 domain-containing protein n=1 Tax=Marinimicrobium sp. ABcell2 TaxID=3069751 RepID=UPI0027B73A4A|nr:DUF1631 domain-containing protein [Marinimicrobium sp. ABcell2]MDQ2078300.1 DUF1631 domain-containing protein [Marinimicrobium sp. ABcell2]